MKITIRDHAYGQTQRINLPKPAWTGREEVGTGIYIEGIYIGRERVIIETDSIWQDNSTGCCVGTRYELATQDDAQMLEERLSTEDYDRVCKILRIETVEA